MKNPKPSASGLRPILPPMLSSEEAKHLMFPPEQEAKYRNHKIHHRFGTLLEYVWLFSSGRSVLLILALLAVVYFLNPGGSWAWFLGTLGLVGLGYILMRSVERALSHWQRNKRGTRRNRYFISQQKKRVTFKDIALPQQALVELKQWVEFLREPQQYQKLGADLEKAFLLVGPSGIGKTLAVSALAGEANVPFIWLEPSPSVLDLEAFFEAGRKNAPSLLFIDDIDSVARSRSIWPDPETQNLEAITTALMSLLDRRDPREGVLLVAATSRPDLIDEALIRPGRLTVIELSYPTLREVEGIFKIYTRKIPLAEDVDLSELASRLLEVCPQCTGAIIAETCNRAAIWAAEKSSKLVNQESFLEAMEKACKATGSRERSAER